MKIEIETMFDTGDHVMVVKGDSMGYHGVIEEIQYNEVSSTITYGLNGRYYCSAEFLQLYFGDEQLDLVQRIKSLEEKLSKKSNIPNTK